MISSDENKSDKTMPKYKQRDISIVIILIVLSAVCFSVGIILAFTKNFTSFGICIFVAILLCGVAIPFHYHGSRYECPKCGHTFKANPYKVFFTNGIFGIFDLKPKNSKIRFLKCPRCKHKEPCKEKFD